LAWLGGILEGIWKMEKKLTGARRHGDLWKNTAQRGSNRRLSPSSTIALEEYHGALRLHLSTSRHPLMLLEVTSTTAIRSLHLPRADPRRLCCLRHISRDMSLSMSIPGLCLCLSWGSLDLYYYPRRALATSSSDATRRSGVSNSSWILRLSSDSSSVVST
jgi:hypothetical protein